NASRTFGLLSALLIAVFERVTTSSGVPLFTAKPTQSSTTRLGKHRDGAFRIVGMHNPAPAYAKRWRSDPVGVVADNQAIPRARLAAQKQVIHIADLTAEPGYARRHPRVVTAADVSPPTCSRSSADRRLTFAPYWPHWLSQRQDYVKLISPILRALEATAFSGEKRPTGFRPTSRTLWNAPPTN